jgi:hypothetical protein
MEARAKVDHLLRTDGSARMAKTPAHCSIPGQRPAEMARSRVDRNFGIFSSFGWDCWATDWDFVRVGGLLRRMMDSPRWFSLERKDAITENPLFPHCLPGIPQRFFCNRPQGEYVVGE